MVDALAGQLGDAVRSGTTLLAGNQRAARAFRKAFDRGSRAQGLAVWAPPAILSWSSWTSSLWQRLLLSGAATSMLLNRTQEHALWRAVIAEDEATSTLQSLDALAEFASTGWASLAQYRGLSRLAASGSSSDTDAFVRWAKRFEERCRGGRWTPQARLEGSLRRAVMEGHLHLEGGLMLAGFDRISPAQDALLQAFADTGVSVQISNLFALPAARLLATAADEHEELRVAAHWVRGFLEEHPEAQVAVVVPRLAERRAKIDRVFRAVLAPGQIPLHVNEGLLPYEFSATQTLAQMPMVRDALLLLAWAASPLEIEGVSELLLSPYLGAEAEIAARAEFDVFELRKAHVLRPEATLEGLIRRMDGSLRRPRMTRTLASLRALGSVVERRVAGSPARTFGDWAEVVRELLAGAGWPGKQVDSLHFQLARRWESCLDELSTLDFDGGRVGFGAALEALRGIVSEAIFAPESHDAPVQILGPEESAGQRFDAVWFLGAGDLTWPVPASGSPLLSWPLRRELGVPGSDSGADMENAVALTRRVAACATDVVVFSYARELAEGNQHPASVLGSLNLVEWSSESVLPGPSAMVELEAVEDRSPIQRLPDQAVRGGASVLQAQAACAFRAFAEHRLFSAGIEVPSPGFDARERGTSVHAMLQFFWDEVRTQAALRAMPLDARSEALGGAIEKALQRAAKIADTAWDEAYLDTQRQRLATLGMEWLNLELARALPFSVAQREAEKEVQIGPLRLSLRIDRVDEVAGGSVLIDYKTGQARPSAWLSDRPDEPQLPLYAVLAGTVDLQAVAFGHVQPGKDMELSGFQESTGILTKAAKQALSLPEQVEAWREVLLHLATSFTEGDARVSPKHYPLTCTHCRQRLICRVEAASFEGGFDDDAEEEPVG